METYRDPQENRPLISVIVPIYNVERYARKCLDSLRGQTQKQIEVIMVDDGSTDQSGQIAEEYLSDDWPVFRIIHHGENRGLSVARNSGLDVAAAEWIMFVDGDDWVEPDFCRIPYKTAIENNADMVIFQADTWKRGKKQKSKPWNGPIGIVDEVMAHEYGSVIAWNKLYRKELFENIHYPVGRVYEDVATTHKIVHLAKKIVLISDCLYTHLIRTGSITQTHTDKNRIDGATQLFKRCSDMIEFGYKRYIFYLPSSCEIYD